MIYLIHVIRTFGLITMFGLSMLTIYTFFLAFIFSSNGLVLISIKSWYPYEAEIEATLLTFLTPIIIFTFIDYIVLAKRDIKRIKGK